MKIGTNSQTKSNEKKVEIRTRVVRSTLLITKRNLFSIFPATLLKSGNLIRFKNDLKNLFMVRLYTHLSTSLKILSLPKDHDPEFNRMGHIILGTLRW